MENTGESVVLGVLLTKKGGRGHRDQHLVKKVTLVAAQPEKSRSRLVNLTWRDVTFDFPTLLFLVKILNYRDRERKNKKPNTNVC